MNTVIDQNKDYKATSKETRQTNALNLCIKLHTNMNNLPSKASNNAL